VITGTPRQAGNGGTLQDGLGTPNNIVVGGSGGIETGTINGTVGNPGVSQGGYIYGGSGAGGGGGQSAGGVAGTGNTGGSPGGGGGGGGGSINGTTSGAGGHGGTGRIIVIEWYS